VWKVFGVALDHGFARCVVRYGAVQSNGTVLKCVLWTCVPSPLTYHNIVDKRSRIDVLTDMQPSQTQSLRTPGSRSRVPVPSRVVHFAFPAVGPAVGLADILR
jgi:hypothetical protein